MCNGFEQSGQAPLTGLRGNGNGHSDFLKVGLFHKQLSDYQLLKMDLLHELNMLKTCHYHQHQSVASGPSKLIHRSEEEQCEIFFPKDNF
jgi:hypothetical protein